MESCGSCAQGAPWRDLPERYWPWKTAHERLWKRTMDEIWEHLLTRVIAKDDDAGDVSG